MQFEELSVGEIVSKSGRRIIFGDKSTQATIYAERAAVSRMGVLDGDPIGSVYIGAGVLYHRVAKAGAAADWYKMTSTNA